MKRIWKISFLSLGILILVLGITAISLYQGVRSITLEDIQNRQQVKQEQGEQLEDLSHQNPQLPSLLQGAVDQAVKLSGKTIDPKDAADAAAILLNSGLSFGDMYKLLGKSTEALSTEEKQEIRNLLLDKLTEDEIEALRSITVDYGKKLVILDPDYPIEAVGVEDEGERKRILEQKPKPKPQQPQAKDKADEPRSEPKPTPANSGDEAKLVKKYEDQLENVKLECSKKAEGLLAKVISSIGNKSKNNPMENKEVWLQDIAAAEGQCDQQFQGLIASAQEEFAGQELAFDVGQEWEQEYQQTKDKIREKALEHIQEELQ